MFPTVILGLMGLFIAYTNGANSNAKGVATLYGSQAATYRGAIILGTAATLAGGLCSIYIAAGLLKSFSGGGLVPNEIAGSPEFMITVAAGAALTVQLATFLGLPVSTTHALTGGLVGAGYVAAGRNFDFHILGSSFLLPLVVSPVLAAMMSLLLNGVLLCRSERPDGAGKFLSEYSVRLLHYASAGAVSFARGLNDTPKLAAILLSIKALTASVAIPAAASAMAIGGLLHARRVAETMGTRIAPLADTTALTANLVTAALTIMASGSSLPVSTTHVAVGAIAGSGAANRSTRWTVVGRIALSWLATLPLAAVLSALLYTLLSKG